MTVKSESAPTYTVTSTDDDAVLAQAAAILRNRVCNGDMFASPEMVGEWLRHELGGQPAESFGVVFLNTRHKLIAFEKLFHGTIDGSEVHPRIVAQRALHLNAAAVILTHNHPSGELEPSTADKTITRKLREALALFDVRTLDHMIVGPTGYLSMAARGYL